MKSALICLAFLVTVHAGALGAPITFVVRFDEAVRATPATGRLVVYLNKATLRNHGTPASGFVEWDPQPLFGVDVTDLKPGDTISVDDSATSFPRKLSELPPGRYRAQAVLDMADENSEWDREAGNLFSDVVNFDTMSPNTKSVQIVLKNVVKQSDPKGQNGVEFVAIRSKLLSDFRKRDVYLRAGVALPVNWDRDRAYPAVYEVPGYGGDHTMAMYKANRRANRPPGTPADAVARNTFWIFLDPESPHGHTLFVDSDVNGPVAKALMTELVPELEKKFNLIPAASARIITGHSSGGWSSLWLATEYPDFFGACWTSSPDPIDFRRWEMVDIYTDTNFYTDANGKEFPGARFSGKVTMTTRDENGMEQVLGDHNDTAQQWDSWMACWGHPDAQGNPKPLFDAITGQIDRDEAETYRRFDIGDRLRKDPNRFAPIFHNNIRLVCGDDDTYFLQEAVKLVKVDLEKIAPPQRMTERQGYIKLVPGDHQSVTGSRAYKNWAKEMLDHLKRSGYLNPTSTTKPKN